MDSLAWPSIGLYCLYGVFVYYQQLHGKNFRGESQGFHAVLNLSAIAGVLTKLAYLVYYGWTVVWWAPLVALALGVLAIIPAVALERGRRGARAQLGGVRSVASVGLLHVPPATADFLGQAAPTPPSPLRAASSIRGPNACLRVGLMSHRSAPRDHGMGDFLGERFSSMYPVCGVGIEFQRMIRLPPSRQPWTRQ